MLHKILASIFVVTGFAFANILYAQDNSDMELYFFEDSLAYSQNDTLTVDTLVVDTTLNVSDMKFPKRLFGKLVYDRFRFNSNVIDTIAVSDENPLYNWINRQKRLSHDVTMLRQRTMFSAPQLVPYNENMLPDPPKEYHAKVDPRKATIVIEEGPVDRKSVKDAPKPVEIKRKNWLNEFEASLHFSQAYNSPNWYQGGNNNLNIICQGMHNVKLNRAFHPNLLFENTIQYKLALNSAPEDSLRNYSISEDLFQINTKFGVRAAKDWFYSVTTMFKTQFLNNYKSNTNDVKAAFLSPGELNVALGMSYSHANAKKTFTFDTSISPLSYNLKICTDDRLNKADFGIDQDKNTASQYGSNAEAKIKWQMAYNIVYTSRMYLFTDYTYVQGDWEHTLAFAVNRYLSTQIYVHLRYDSSTPRIENSKWHTWQLKEILSFGLTYKFATV